MTQRDTTGWTQSAILLLRKILRGILTPFLAARAPVTSEIGTDGPASPEIAAASSDNVVFKVPPAAPEPRSLEELFGIDVNDSTASAPPSTTTLEELFGVEPNVQSWRSRSTTPDPQPSDEQSFKNLRSAPLIADPWTSEFGDEDFTQANSKPSDHEPSQPLSPSHRTETSPMIDLSLDNPDGTPNPQPEPLELENTLINRASRGDLEAFRQLLNDDLAVHGAEVFDVESRESLLQLSLCGAEVPAQKIVEPIIKTWVLHVGFVKVEKIELYGHRNGSELPHWRSEFNPSELEYQIEPQDVGFEAEEVPPEIAQYWSDIEPVVPKTQDAPPNLELWDPPASPSTFDPADPNPMVEPLSDAIDAQAINDFGAMAAVPQELPVANDSSTDPVVAPFIVEDATGIEKRKIVQSFLAQYAGGERSFIKIDLSETNLSGINLTLADLQEAQLVWANLQDASLYHVNLSGAKLRHANLNGAKLRSANLQGADFLNADLSHSDLTWSNLRGANLTGANLANADLKNAILENVIMPDGTLLD